MFSMPTITRMLPENVLAIHFDSLMGSEITESLERKLLCHERVGRGSGVDRRVFLAEPGTQPYRLYAHISKQLPSGSKVVDAIGSADFGATALAWSCNPNVRVVSFQSQHQDAAVVVVESTEVIDQLLSTLAYKGIIIAHRINKDQDAMQFWSRIAKQHCDISKYGHYQGTGIVVCDAAVYDIHFPVYRLGNMVDTWYAQAFMPLDEQRRFRDARMIYFNYAKSTLGEHLGLHRPKFMPTSLPLHFSKTLRNWWWMHYQNLIDLHPHFTESLRHAITSFRPLLPRPSTDRTCVVHYRIGDYLNHKKMLAIEDLVGAIKLFTTTPDRIEVLSGGMQHLTNEWLRCESRLCLERLVRLLGEQCPVVTIDAGSPDDDFFRMVSAPMLLAGNSSFAIMAAVANKNQRLTPSKLDLDGDGGGATPIHVFEGWRTFAVDKQLKPVVV